MEQTKNYEIVYLLSNPSMPNIYKIGCTKKNDVTQRMQALDSTGVPTPFQCLRASKVQDCKQAENMLHKAFAKYRINARREFFKIDDIDMVLAVFDYINESGADMTEEIRIESDKNVSDIEKEDIIMLTRKQKSPRINFKAMHIPVGARLQFARDNSIEVEVANGKNQVLYKEVKTSLSNATKQILGISYGVRPTGKWIYGGGKLFVIFKAFISK